MKRNMRIPRWLSGESCLPPNRKTRVYKPGVTYLKKKAESCKFFSGIHINVSPSHHKHMRSQTYRDTERHKNATK